MAPRLRALLVLIAALAFGLSPIFTPDFRGYDPSQLPVQAGRPSILPAGYAFSIWGLIYLWLLVHAGYGLWKRAEDPVWDATRLPLLVSLAVGAIWLAVAVRSPFWASILIVVMLVGALLALKPTRDAPDHWFLAGPIALFAGWLTAANGVSWGVLISGFGLLDDRIAAYAMLLVVLNLALYVLSRLTRATEYGLALIWALAAIIVANGTAVPTVSGLALIGIVLVAIYAVRALNKAA
ncbi:hypothetical protein L0V05_12525 [Tabrizicola sp. J26]|uniref:hypothetical protein n=1 Tax=Alitabrizicola rongguiensis TaxID=2909234 RepID=UPI001F2FCBC1|nr:hypothetical protein [Tabrizicola rongguiensis]MCF1709638.1 hypothetical protein [Tabrizicola rongguiensis]